MSSVNRYRTPNDSIRPGFSPSDLVHEVRLVDLVGGEVEITPDAKNGTLVGYQMYKTATVEDGVVTLSKALPGDTDKVLVVLAYKAQNLQDGANAFA